MYSNVHGCRSSNREKGVECLLDTLFQFISRFTLGKRGIPTALLTSENPLARLLPCSKMELARLTPNEQSRNR